MTTETVTAKLTGEALISKVRENSALPENRLAMLCGYTRTNIRAGKEVIKADLEGYFKALLAANSIAVGTPRNERRTAPTPEGATNSFKVQYNSAGIVPRRYFEALGCVPGEYFLVNEGVDPATGEKVLVLRKDLERSALAMQQIQRESQVPPAESGIAIEAPSAAQVAQSPQAPLFQPAATSLQPLGSTTVRLDPQLQPA